MNRDLSLLRLWREEPVRARPATALLAFGGLVPVSLIVFSTGWAQIVQGARMGPMMLQQAHAFSRWYIWLYVASILLAILITTRLAKKDRAMARRAMVGAAAGALATFALDGWRLTGVVQGWLPMDTPILFGSVLLGTGHHPASVYAVGMAYHIANGASFGLIYAILWGRQPTVGAALARGVGLLLVIELGMMTLPPMQPMVGAFGVDHAWPQLFLVTLVAHVAFGVVLVLIVHGAIKTVSDQGIAPRSVGKLPPMHRNLKDTAEPTVQKESRS